MALTARLPPQAGNLSSLMGVLAHAPVECSAHSKDTTALQMFLDLDDSDIVDISIPTLASTFCMSSTVAPT